MSLIPSSVFLARPKGALVPDGWSAESVSFWITRSNPQWASDRLVYRWPQLCFGRMALRLSKHAGGMLRIDLGGAALQDRWLTLQNERVTEHRLDLC